VRARCYGGCATVRARACASACDGRSYQSPSRPGCSRSRCSRFTFLGKEFLPELDEGDIWLRVKFPIGISLEDANPYVHDIRKRLLTFPEVARGGLPARGAGRRHRHQWPRHRRVLHRAQPRGEWRVRDKSALVEAMTARLENIRGITTNFSQPIKDNVDEARAGVKGEMAIKLYGRDVFELERIGDRSPTCFATSAA